MKVFTIDYSYDNLSDSEYLKNFKTILKSALNCIYFFFEDDECLYVGETGATLYDRCYINTPKHSDRDFFKMSNRIHVIVLDDTIDLISRKAIEAVFIQSYRPPYNFNKES